MSKKYYKLYIDNNIQLAETIVVKSDWSARSINEWVSARYGEDSVSEHDKTTWKYYKNICGEYHSTDEMIYITSLDTVGTIAFTKENLTLHPTTKLAYRHGSRYFRELLLENPNRDQLILGVLYPANMAEAIAAKDGTILSYPKYLVEDYEVSLIKNLQHWIDTYILRWYNIQFNNNHVFYDMTFRSIMHLNMVSAILNLRLKACRTDEVHSFHIREYLASHGELDQYMDYMTRKQALFFYRNINYIDRNAGKQDTFYWLVENVLTDRGIPLSRFTMRHNVANMPESNYPEISFRKSPVNQIYSQQDVQDNNYSLERVLEKETPLAPYNAKFISEKFPNIKNLFIDSRSNVVQTKMLESSIIDYTDATPYTLQDIGFNHWSYLSSIGLYNAYVRIVNPRTGVDIVLQSDEAFIYYLYLFAKSVGVSFDNIPVFAAMRVSKIPVPNVTQLLSVVNTSRIPASKALEIINTQPTIGPIVSVNGFKNKAVELFEAAQVQLGIVSLEEKHFDRGMIENMVNSLYLDTIIDFTDGVAVNYKEWISERRLPDDDLTAQDCDELYKTIYESATGIPLRTTAALGALQKSMLAIMSQLSSYSIQFLATINAASVRPLGWAAIRPDDLKTVQNSLIQTEISDTTVVDMTVVENSKVAIEIDPIVVGHEVITNSSNKRMIEIPVKVSPNLNLTTRHIELAMYNYSVDSPIFQPSQGPGPIRYLPSYQSFYDLTQDEKMSIKSVHDHCFPDAVINTHIDTADAISRDTLASFKYISLSTNKLTSFKFIYMPSDVANGVKVVISADLDALTMTGATLGIPGLVMIGYDHVLDMFANSNQTLQVEGLVFRPLAIHAPKYGLQEVYDIGYSLRNFDMSDDEASFTFNPTFKYMQMSVSYVGPEKLRINYKRITERGGIDYNFDALDNSNLNIGVVTEGYQPSIAGISDKTIVTLKYSGIEYQNMTTVYNGGNAAILYPNYTKSKFQGLMTGPFLTDYDSIGKPFYNLGKFVVNNGKVEFE